MATGFSSRLNGGTSAPKRVIRTGLALVHENEIVYPAAGSEAQARLAIDDSSANIDIHFPVVIEVADGGGNARAAMDAEDIARDQARRLSTLLRRR
jgi:hypothetical protein